MHWPLHTTRHKAHTAGLRICVLVARVAMVGVTKVAEVAEYTTPIGWSGGLNCSLIFCVYTDCAFLITSKTADRLQVWHFCVK